MAYGDICTGKSLTATFKSVSCIIRSVEIFFTAAKEDLAGEATEDELVLSLHYRETLSK